MATIMGSKDKHNCTWSAEGTVKVSVGTLKKYPSIFREKAVELTAIVNEKSGINAVSSDYTGLSFDIRNFPAEGRTEALKVHISNESLKAISIAELLKASDVVRVTGIFVAPLGTYGVSFIEAKELEKIGFARLRME